ncbi:MAG TPA: DNA starvation/stationary phase protection protein [Chitinophagales bacterium]|nr:DNA starvation/stationary phase protection protein [Chitinophagales bacterium]HNM32392.1 DNA starvation/stationary phase protection protein [Chitinophagales bacterium]
MKAIKNNTQIGLDRKQSEALAIELNTLLANYQLYYQNTRGLHWNIKGKHFFELHVKFEEIYTDAQEKVDLIAERVLTLGFTPMHTFSDYLKHATIKEGKNIHEAKEAVELIVSSLQTIIILERAILKTAAVLNDEGTTTLLTDFITQQEKEIWMYSSWLNH